ncbi:hypothetical protein GCM10010988_05740 [Cnuibacter physcomitrellae]|uniref:Uncharacterized protein n=1 Tax=Cnuibacter physcomitrellae TaxID=1619308 RepID=A0A1X9LJU9_9MICO|nr:hypothetical protein B5808_09805 [Cnuibacter physcomitrellae]GGI35795.1 hypothetical protein GCM10010988_05740 [Cnuibacter physcomitrellae]
MHALPGARRSLRSLSVISVSLHMIIFIACVDRLRATFPLRGRRGERLEVAGSRYVASTIWSRLRRLPAPLSRDDELPRWRLTRLAGGFVDGCLWRFARRPQYARERSR